jgi:uncharacterized protein (DUF2336 family)
MAMKSAYELALERMERDGIERPRKESLSKDVRDKIAEVRRQSEAKLAELEILHRDALKKIAEPEARKTAEEHYARERDRLESARERKIEKLRGG